MFFKKNTFCPRLWEEVYIDEKGNVFSCCHNKPKIIGNIYKQKLKEIYNTLGKYISIIGVFLKKHFLKLYSRLKKIEGRLREMKK